MAGRGAAIIYLSAWVVAASCTRAATIEQESSSPAATEIAFDCGQVTSRVNLRCDDVVVEDEMVLSPGPEVPPPEPLLSLECDPSPGSVSEEVSGGVEAWCDAVGSVYPATFQRGLHLRGTARSVCPKYGKPSGTVVGATWTSRLTLPAGSFRVALLTNSDAERPSCVVELDGIPSDPVRLGLSRIAMTFVEGPAELEVALQCDSYAASSCTNTADNPPRTCDTLDLLVDVSVLE